MAKSGAIDAAGPEVGTNIGRQPAGTANHFKGAVSDVEIKSAGTTVYHWDFEEGVAGTSAPGGAAYTLTTN